MRYRSDNVVAFSLHVLPDKRNCWLMGTRIFKINFNLGDLIKDENNLQSIKLKIKEKLKENYSNLVFDNNIPIKVEMYCSISHSAENLEKNRRTRIYFSENTSIPNKRIGDNNKRRGRRG